MVASAPLPRSRHGSISNAMLRPSLLRPASLLLLVVTACGPSSVAQDAGARDAAPSAPASDDAPARVVVPTDERTPLYEVVNVVDGDTVHVLRDGVREKLRLLSVDTEEKLSGNPNLSATKPETLFGQETTEWAQRFIPEHSSVDGRTMVSLRFPGGREARDVYGRLLCHVVLADGTDFNVLLVRQGKSPYFNKYGNSTICHEAFVAAQRAARAEGLGVWDPATNTPDDPNAPAAKRPYDRLLPWWDARATAIDLARARHARNPVLNVEADRADDVQLAAWASEGGATVEVFGAIDRIFVEDDGSRTLLMRTGDKARAVRATIAAEHLARFDLADLARRAEAEFVQNYLVLRGTLAPNAERGGWILALTEPEQVRVGGPEPVLPAKGDGTRH